MRYRLRTLPIVFALGPPALAGAWFAATKLAESQQPKVTWEAAIRKAHEVSPHN